ncbi:MAG: hypothetical protein ACFNVV_06905, partial [Bacteroidota bacterium]
GSLLHLKEELLHLKECILHVKGGYPIFAYHLHETKQQTNLFTAPFPCLQTPFNFIKGQEVR